MHSFPLPLPTLIAGTEGYHFYLIGHDGHLILCFGFSKFQEARSSPQTTYTFFTHRPFSLQEGQQLVGTKQYQGR